MTSIPTEEKKIWWSQPCTNEHGHMLASEDDDTCYYCGLLKLNYDPTPPETGKECKHEHYVGGTSADDAPMCTDCGYIPGTEPPETGRSYFDMTPKEKQEVLNKAAKESNRVQRIEAPETGSEWELEFDASALIVFGKGIYLPAVKTYFRTLLHSEQHRWRAEMRKRVEQLSGYVPKQDYLDGANDMKNSVLAILSHKEDL